jgi:hypothetical protein
MFNVERFSAHHKQSSEDARMTNTAQNHFRHVREYIGQAQPQNAQASARGQGMGGLLISKGAALLGHTQSSEDYQFQIAKEYLSCLGSANYRVSSWGDEWRVNIDSPSVEVVAPSFTLAIVKASTAHVRLLMWGDQCL